MISSATSHYDDAKLYFEREVDALRDSPDQVRIALAYTSLADVYDVQGLFSLSKRSFDKALLLLERNARSDDLRVLSGRFADNCRHLRWE